MRRQGLSMLLRHARRSASSTWKREMSLVAAMTSSRVSGGLSEVLSPPYLGSPFQSSAGLSRGFAADADSGLLKAIKDELEFEDADIADPEDLKVGPPSHFKVDEQPGTADLVLRKTYEGEDIAVVVSYTEEIFGGDEEEQEDEDVEEQEEDEEVEDNFRALPLSARITISKAGDQPPLEVMVAVTADDEWVVQELGLVDADVAGEALPYAGPPFDTLDPQLREQFENYLRRRGFTSLLARFVRRYLEAKEQREYKRWLKRVGAFVALK